ncbi:MarR family winged helix-turn-helix transcriptional regulator [Paractinoplanes durhamensis]|uniref:MarR family transcriptional regulator n=1 Tax=Paractinoplanes durhamensis TaxID=113563 RepID=A0ABQ3YSX5_9ACTN|nr:MarR family transcriptional regulator [Actinoplanes durhamensis]GIE00637.1 MarR family transcriptional regulator [Actinoplanes durhamensis]
MRDRKESDLPDRLVRLVQGTGRALVQAARRAGQVPALPESQVAVLRRLSHAGGRTPAQLADDLHLARPTISNVVRDLTEGGLVSRQPSPVDGRSVLLVPTARAEGMLDAFRQGRAEVMARAVAELPAEDRERITAALPSLALLLDRIRAQA